MKHIFGALVGCLLLVCAWMARAEDFARPLLLVAAPTLQGPYSRTAVIVVPLGDKHIGFILNRATDQTLGALFPDHAPSAKVIEPVFFGGPEADSAIFALLRRDPGQPSMRLFGDVYMTGSGNSIDRIIEQTPNDARYFAGFVGWMPGELDMEIEKRIWYVGDADPELVFQKDTGAMWEQLLERLGKGILRSASR